MYFKNGLKKNEHINEIEKYARVIDKKFFLSQEQYLGVNHYIYYADSNIHICMHSTLNKVAEDKKTVTEKNEFIIYNSEKMERWCLYSQVKSVLGSISRETNNLQECLEKLNIKIDFNIFYDYLNNYSELEENVDILSNPYRNLNFFEFTIPLDISLAFSEESIKKENFNKQINDIIYRSFLNNVFKTEIFNVKMRECILRNKIEKTEKTSVVRVKSKI